MRVVFAGLLSAVCLLPLGRLRAQGVRVEFHAVTREAVQERLRTVSPKDSEREAELKSLFQEAGCGAIDEQVVARKDPPNITCTLPGMTESLILVGAHSDHVEQGLGAVDDWSGASLLPSLFQALKDSPRKHTFAFIGFTDEEKGLVGSNFYVKHLPQEWLAKIRATVNLECLGLGPTEVWADVANPELLEHFAGIVRSMQLPLIGVNVERVGNDDTQAFRNKKVPVITLHSLTQSTFPILHTVKDNLGAVDLDHLYDSYRLIGLYLAYIDQVLN